ncbi:beta-1,6-N-acetylglucosaminyltransferase [Flavobacterium yafengii]|uniref:beta-1,6-N-acetylglucosaminyltransferase n=1 Tax=Flavobacterium yafengii TaxID=3041253 RepID=UPI0024A8399D|nr:beta-1,6-N-acetylglucosaminyltransferase [Flavobacterium yafengii]MDI6046609.1 beta-1,6-N-acetylglucosaminyltransferase [Flavobacterium yafengii]
MKQAILITAYKNYHHLEEIIHCFDTSFELYIHIDKKSEISDIELTNLRKHDIVKLVEQKYKVNWGGFNHLKSILYIAEQALKNSDNHYFHLITGHDFPIKTSAYFLDFFKDNTLEYLEHFSIPKIGHADNDNMDRIEYYNFYDLWNYKIHKQYEKIALAIRLQKRLGFKRSISTKMPKLYGGSTYWSLSRECLEYVLEFTKKNKFVLNRFKYTLCAEEFYFQTVIMNSNFADKVANDNLRHIDWVARNGNNPAVLDETDYEKLTQTNAVFARKFEYPKSAGLINKIKSFVNE